MNERCASCGTPLDPHDRFCGGCGGPRASAPVAAPKPTARAASPMRFVSLGVGVLISVAGFAFFGLQTGGCDDSVEGRVAVSGGPHGDFTFAPTGCASMQPFGRFGANLHGDGPNDGAVYITIDPLQGKSVDVEVPGSCRNADGTDCTVFRVPRDRCTTFEANVEHSGVTVNDVRLVEGRVSLDCALEDGTSVRGTVDFGGC